MEGPRWVGSHEGQGWGREVSQDSKGDSVRTLVTFYWEPAGGRQIHAVDWGKWSAETWSYWWAGLLLGSRNSLVGQWQVNLKP